MRPPKKLGVIRCNACDKRVHKLILDEYCISCYERKVKEEGENGMSIDMTDVIMGYALMASESVIGGDRVLPLWEYLEDERSNGVNIDEDLAREVMEDFYTEETIDAIVGCWNVGKSYETVGGEE